MHENVGGYVRGQTVLPESRQKGFPPSKCGKRGVVIVRTKKEIFFPVNLKNFQGFFAEGGNWYTTVRKKQRHFLGTFVAMIFSQKSKFMPPGSKITFCSKRPDIVPNVTWTYPYIQDLTYVLDKLKESKIFEMSQNLLWYIFEVIWVGQSYGTLLYIFLFDGKKKFTAWRKKKSQIDIVHTAFPTWENLALPLF